MTTQSARAVVQRGPRQLALTELPIPDIGDEHALLRVDACGLCGSDLEQYDGNFAPTYPTIPGHEIVGTIDRIGDAAALRWGVTVGDRVAVEPRLVCHRCGGCLRGGFCERYPITQLRNFGQIPLAVEPGLWGGYAEYLFLHGDASIHKVPGDLAPEHAVLFNPLANAIEWSVNVPQPQFGDFAVVLGAGQRGLACVIALKARGIQRIVVTGLSRDAHKLALAEQLGAIPVDIETTDLGGVVSEASGGTMAALVIDTTPRAVQSIADAMSIAREGGTIVVGGVKRQLMDGFNSDALIRKDLTLRGGVAASHDAYAQAIDMTVARLDEVSRLHTHKLDLADAERALQLLRGNEPNERVISVALMP